MFWYSFMKVRWVGIDEAGYGPKLGPLTMAAVVAEGEVETRERPDLWCDLRAKISRAGSKDGESKLWVDDSKRVHSGRLGTERLEAATFALLQAAHPDRRLPERLSGLLRALDAGDFARVELNLWLSEPADDPFAPRVGSRQIVDRATSTRPLEGAADWRIVAAKAAVVGPFRFNRALAESPSGLKSDAHFATFAELLRWVWEMTEDGVETFVRVDKHGGRHYYLEPLSNAFPGHWIERGEEGPQSSRYLLREAGRRLELSFQPKADLDDGLTALASIISKTLREYWMSVFNGFWISRLPSLRPTAGYPADAERFRAAIVDQCRELGLAEDRWWREK